MADIPRTQFRDAERGRHRSMSTQQWGALIAGGALAIYGITRRSKLGIALAAGGGTLAVLGTRKKSQDESSTWTSLLVNCTPQDAYQFWRKLDNLPLFMNRLESVTVLDERRSRWVAIGPFEQSIEWESEITDERENEYIAWRSLPGSDLQVDGRVEFQQAPAGRGTLINVRMEFGSATNTAGAMVKFMRKGANFAIRQDMRRLEALMEAGEIPTTEGQSHGPRDLVTGLMRAADPTRPIRAGSSLRNVFGARRRVA